MKQSMMAATIIGLLTVFIIVRSAPVITDEVDGMIDYTDKVTDRHRGETLDVPNYLNTFGYLPLESSQDTTLFDLSDAVFRDALRDFQRFNGLEVTGSTDDATLSLMKRPRCGVTDVHNYPNSAVGQFDPTMPLAYRALGSRWTKDTVTWKPTKFSEKLSRGEQWRTFRKALELWSSVIPIKFRYSPIKPDMEIRFKRREHGDGKQNRFDGRGGVLAHAFGPGPGLGGDTHFDEDEIWTVASDQGTDLGVIAAHEFGHALGLGHSASPGALMAPYYTYVDELTLGEDDVRGIQSLYGKKTTTPWTRRPVTQRSSTPRPRRTTTMDPSDSFYCDRSFRLDAISNGPDGYMYAYRGDYIYKVGQDGLVSGYPKYIRQVFPEAPTRHVRAVTYIPKTRTTYMFKDSRVWRFTGFILDQSYPYVWTSDSYYRPSAALTLTHKGNSQVFMFGHDNFWEWNQQTEKVVQGYPLPMATYFRYAPLHPDAVYVAHNGHFVFFKYNYIKDMMDRGGDSNQHSIGPNLFGSSCQGTVSLRNLKPRQAHYDESSFWRHNKGQQLDNNLENEDLPPMILALTNKSISGTGTV